MNRPLPCPFCGSEAVCDPVPAGVEIYHQVYCRSVLTCGAAGSARPDERDAIASWNRRAAVPVGLAAEPSLHWRCFHCDYVARTREEATAHFGSVINMRPAVCITHSAGSMT